MKNSAIAFAILMMLPFIGFSQKNGDSNLWDFNPYPNETEIWTKGAPSEKFGKPMKSVPPTPVPKYSDIQIRKVRTIYLCDNPKVCYEIEIEYFEDVIETEKVDKDVSKISLVFERVY